ncbi:MAG TPA: hypothetical protein VKW06_22535 [Candidatus Angelobacter sp.]|nr:hypothetical protein [Candidatus Angelobacter sp.]
MFSRLHLLLILIGSLLISLPAHAHVGSPDAYYEGMAGPYRVLVVIQPPAVVPGVAQIQVRSLDGDIGRIEILPLTMQGPGASLAPRPDTMQHSTVDPKVFSGSLWIMLRGSWKVQVQAEGTHGKGEVDVPVAAVSMTAARMNSGMGAMMSAFGLLLAIALIGIVRSANGDAQLAPQAGISASLKRRSRVGTTIGILVIVLLVSGGYLWWGVEARANELMVYRVPHLDASLRAGNKLQVKLENPNGPSFKDPDWQAFWAQTIKGNDLVPDHGHLMHLFLVRLPDMKSFWHLHPETANYQDFTASLPAVPGGHYQIYADIVHSTGFPETQVGTIDVPSEEGEALRGDDSGGASLAASDRVAELSDGYRMAWERDSSPLHAQQAILFRFRVEDKNGKPAGDLENYMGMAGHAVFMSDDGKVFAHIHPEGSVSMAALTMAQAAASDAAKMPAMNMPISAEVSFPYGFPQAGDYHLFVQVKRAGKVETGVFAAHVLP